MENETNVTANREYKSTLFCMLFRDRKELLELYNAVNHSDYTDPEALEIVTLENAIYMSMKNDLAFLIDTHLNLYEHQSTFNPNMPLRDLLYFIMGWKQDRQKRYSAFRMPITLRKNIRNWN